METLETLIDDIGSGVQPIMLTETEHASPLDIESITEGMANASGDSFEVSATEKAISDMTTRRGSLQSERQANVTSMTADQNAIAARLENFNACKGHTGGGASKKWDCPDGFHNDPWYQSEKSSLTTAQSGIKLYSDRISAIDAELAQIEKNLPAAQDKLITLRESVYRASMTPAELQQYDATQKVAKAQADATAQAITESAKSSSKNKTIIYIAGGVALVTAVVLFFVFKGKKTVKV